MQDINYNLNSTKLKIKRSHFDFFDKIQEDENFKIDPIEEKINQFFDDVGIIATSPSEKKY